MTIHAHTNQDNLDTIIQNLGPNDSVQFDRLNLGFDSTAKFAVGETTGSEAVDQSQLTDTFGTNTNDAWQSFTPDVDGFLTAVSFTFGGAITRTFEIYEGEGNGGTVLLSMPSTAFISGTTKVTLSTPVPLKAGRQYTAGIVGNGFPRLNNVDDYAGGRSSVSSFNDMVFQTFMVPANIDLIVDSEGQVGIGVTNPQSPVHIGNLPTSELEIVDAGTIGATESGWVEVSLDGGASIFLRGFATK